jgi:hypothetical protein
LDAYAFNSHNNLLYIHERFRGIKVYSYPEFKVHEKLKFDEGLMNIESLNNEVLFIPESSKDQKTTQGLRLYNPSTNSYKRLEEISNLAASMEISYPNTITPKGNDSLLYANPGAITNIYHIDNNEVRHLGGIDFGKFNIPEEYWSCDDYNDFKKVFQEGLKATWVQNLIVYPQKWLFFFVFVNDDKDKNFHMGIINTQNKDSRVYSKITINKNGIALPRPIGIHKGYYVTLIYPEFITDYLPDQPNDSAPEWQHQLYQKRESDTPKLLTYKIE